MSSINIYENVDSEKMLSIQNHINDNSTTLETVVNEIIQPYCKDLDNYIKFIADCLRDGENPPTNLELEDFCLNLSTYIYFAGGMCEQLGIRNDISKAIYRETYNVARASQSSGTVADKDSMAELSSQQELLTNICYDRAWKTMKAKVANAQELLASCKKVLSRRMQEYELTHLGGN